MLHQNDARGKEPTKNAVQINSQLEHGGMAFSMKHFFFFLCLPQVFETGKKTPAIWYII